MILAGMSTLNYYKVDNIKKNLLNTSWSLATTVESIEFVDYDDSSYIINLPKTLLLDERDDENGGQYKYCYSDEKECHASFGYREDVYNNIKYNILTIGTTLKEKNIKITLCFEPKDNELRQYGCPWEPADTAISKDYNIVYKKNNK